MGFEPTTPGLKVRSSTAELQALASGYKFRRLSRRNSLSFSPSPVLKFETLPEHRICFGDSILIAGAGASQ